MSDVEEFTAEEEALLRGEGEQAEEPPQEEPKEEPKEEAKAEPESETEDEGEKPVFKSQREPAPEGFVSHAALHKERELRKQFQSELDDMKAQLEAMKAPKEEPPQWVDPIEDPQGHKAWEEWRYSQVQNKVEEFTKAQQQQAEQQQQLQQIAQAEAAFKQTAPDYDEAVTFMKNARIEQLRGQGFEDQQIGAFLQQDVQGILQAANAMQISPAELAYLRAGQMGYKRQAPTPEPKPDPQEVARMQATQRAQEQTQTLSHAGGESQGGTLSAEAIANMSEAEIAKLSEADIAKAFGVAG